MTAPAVDFEHLIFDTPVDGVAQITLNRPEAHNALSMALHRELDAALSAAERDTDVRAIVIAGAGGTAFSAGYDIHEMQDWDEDEALLTYLEREPIMWHVAACTKPTVAAVTGFAYGGGAVTAIACDLRVGGPSTRFKVTATAYGGVNASWSLPLIVGTAKAKEWLLTARVIEADEAYANGLLNAVVPDDEVLTAAREMAAAIARNTGAATQAAKAMINGNVGRSFADAQRAETNLMATALRPGRVVELFAGFLADH